LAQDIQVSYQPGKTLYAIVLNSAGQAWTGYAFEAPVTGDWASYANALTEATGTGLYFAAFPGGITEPGPYRVVVYAQAGGSPSYANDTVVSEGLAQWTGAGLVTAVGGFGTGQDPASQLFANERFRAMASYVDGKYAYNPATGVLTLYDTDGATVLLTATLTFDSTGNITARTVSGAG